MSAHALTRRATFSAAWWGIAMVIATEAMLFGSFVATYFYLHFKSPAWPPHGDHAPSIATSLILTACLVASSAPMAITSWAAAAGQLVKARLALVVALIVQAGYAAYEVDDFRSQLHASNITRDQYTSIYYTLLGADHVHVAVGIVLVVWLLWKLLRGLTMYRLNAIQAVAFYWHAVNLLTLIVIGVLTSATI